MNCPEVQELLSAYYDGELDSERQTRVAAHLTECPLCAQEFSGFEKLSQLAAALPQPAPPDNLWSDLSRQLDEAPAATPVDRLRRRPFPIPTTFVAAAMLLIAVGLGWLAFHAASRPGSDAGFHDDIGSYLDEFRRDPESAERRLLAKYSGQTLDVRQAAGIQQAVRQLGYRPAIADGLPQEYSIQSASVLKMPCCTCVKCLCKRSDGTAVAIFEHNDETPNWFRHLPAISVDCNGTPCRLVELEGRLAASWKRGTRFITVIGLKDVAEVSPLIAALDPSHVESQR